MLREVNVAGLTIDPMTNSPIMILKDINSDQAVPIWIGLLEATAIASELENIKFSRPMTHDLLKNVIDIMEGQITRIEVCDLRDNTYFALILPYVAFSLPFTTLLIRGFMVSLPSELMDAALIDGCSKFGIFFRIILPLSRPIIAVATVIQCVFLWNEYLLALVFVNKRNLMTLPVGLMDFVGEFHTDWVAMAAGLCMATIPIIIVYIIFRKQILIGMTTGALKG